MGHTGDYIYRMILFYKCSQYLQRFFRIKDRHLRVVLLGDAEQMLNSLSTLGGGVYGGYVDDQKTGIGQVGNGPPRPYNAFALELIVDTEIGRASCRERV